MGVNDAMAGTSQPAALCIDGAAAPARHIRLAYVMYNERMFDGLIHTQVLDLLQEIKRQSPLVEVTLVSFLPLWVVLRQRIEINTAVAESQRFGIRIEIYPWAIPYQLFLFNARLVTVVKPWVACLFRTVLRHRFDVVQGRSYFPCLIIASLQKALGYRSIFDMRSLFIEEHLSVGTWTAKDPSYAQWKAWERWILERMDVAIGVSQPMVEVIQEITSAARAEMIPCCVDTETFQFDAEARDRIRAENGWDHRLVVAYEGNLGKFNDFATYVEYFTRIVRVQPQALFLVLTPAPPEELGEDFQRAGLQPDQYMVRSAQGQELSHWLSAADVGLQTTGRSLDRGTRLSVKFVEYLSCGLPVLCNSNVGGAARVTREREVGAVIDLEDAQIDEKLSGFVKGPRPPREHCRQVAEDLFSVHRCAQRYLNLYQELMNQR